MRGNKESERETKDLSKITKKKRIKKWKTRMDEVYKRENEESNLRKRERESLFLSYDVLHSLLDCNLQTQGKEQRVTNLRTRDKEKERERMDRTNIRQGSGERR